MAKQLLVTIPTLSDNMVPFDLDAEEQSIFETFSAAGFWIAVFRVPGLPRGVQYVDATTYRPYNMSPTFGLSRLLPASVDDLYTGFFNGEYDTADDDALAAAVDSIISMTEAVTGVPVPADEKPTVVEWKRVTPWRPVMAANAIRDGTWAEMYALQGHRNTWYNGVIFNPGGPQIWNYTETVLLPQMLASL